ncbi:uncharacterized protein [Clytia hemisphaerica]|uniref:uncharacterized protein n=1 Tax=Clytia hemisphaerica TaxID=252671 RepID=UPI0034D3D1DC
MDGEIKDSRSKRSSYYHKLPAEAKSRYDAKLLAMQLVYDPLVIGKTYYQLTDHFEQWPNLSYADIYAYLIDHPSTYSHQQLKAYKGLDGYKYVIAKLVNNVLVKPMNLKDGNYHLVMAKVRHGQSMFSKTPPRAWVYLNPDGEVCYAHCTCMAGLGEACSHIAAILFLLYMSTNHRERMSSNSCTSLECPWLPDSAVKEVECLPISKIDFSDPKKRTESDTTATTVKEKNHINPFSSVPKPTKDEQSAFFKSLVGNSAALSLIPEYSDDYVPFSARVSHNPAKLFDIQNQKLHFHDIIALSERYFNSMAISEEEIAFIEFKTREQAKSNFWFKMRAGIITASNFRKACHTDIQNPSQTLILDICYPSTRRFTSASTEHGNKFEKDARNTLNVYLSSQHQNCVIKDCGLYRSQDYPFLGASPDGIMECSCCSVGYVIEVKCPHKCTKSDMIHLADTDNDFCMEKEEGTENKYKLKQDHPYYYQVQLQMLITGIPRSYFIVYSPTVSLIQEIFIDPDFLNEKVPISKQFYVNVILPELTSKWYSRKYSDIPEFAIENTSSVAENDSEDLCCTCNREVNEDIIVCGDKSCVVRVYHLKCVGLDSAPKRKWFCPYCSKKKTRKSKTKVAN